jgi:hypothetical protein
MAATMECLAGCWTRGIRAAAARGPVSCSCSQLFLSEQANTVTVSPEGGRLRRLAGEREGCAVEGTPWDMQRRGRL